ncbi:hypothetical protein DIE14_21995 [Burkholderia sp. Bp9017]|uniref:hypothetical protein n=1 Tax=unclassified Burkholderia TaxID=2613784 RepID=UPI000F5EF907|nr:MULTISPECIES: hypothetical protein [unclassified Burkholderia]RQZ24185.1 hypothetical protein DIE14_21995 [Burkholderia sp. Bp9017]RQZ32155.1 hypothetical protein DIE13_21875 [Burkholderia sp. Bp9016]
MFSFAIAITTCLAVWLLTGSEDDHRRVVGAALGLVDSLLWILAAIDGRTYAVAIVAIICAICFARPIVRHFSALLARGAV